MTGASVSLLAASAVAFVALIGGAFAAPAKLPPGLKICARDDPLFNTCLKNAVTDALPVVAKGLPTLSIPPCDPLDIKKLEIGEGSGPVKINLLFKDIKIMGIKESYVETIKADLDNFHFDIRVRFNSPLRIHGPYKVSGSVLVLPITGEGISNITLDDIVADITVEGDHIKKGGEDFIKIKTFDLKLNVKHLSINLTNLFNGDKALGDTMNYFINENWEEIFKELQPAFEETLGATFQQITAQFFRKVPFDQVFPIQSVN